MTLEDELREFHAHHQAIGSTHFSFLPSDAFTSLNDYLEYLRTDIELATYDVELNGGAQFRRLMSEVEIFLRLPLGGERVRGPVSSTSRDGLCRHPCEAWPPP